MTGQGDTASSSAPPPAEKQQSKRSRSKENAVIRIVVRVGNMLKPMDNPEWLKKRTAATPTSGPIYGGEGEYDEQQHTQNCNY